MLDVKRSIAGHAVTLCALLSALACGDAPNVESSTAPSPPVAQVAATPANSAPNVAAAPPANVTPAAPNNAHLAPPPSAANTNQTPSQVAPEQPVSLPVMKPSGLPVGPSSVEQTNPPGQTTIPTDDRAIVKSTQSPLPISGGTLLVSSDSTQIYASDPERDRVSIVDVFTQSLLANVSLQVGDEPGRLAQDDGNRIHVVLRRAGAVATIDLWTHTVSARRAVCAAPRGIVYEPSTKLLHVACMGGEVVSLPAASGDVSARTLVDSDLRDLVLRNNGLWVTRAKSAELLQLDANRSVLTRQRPQTPSLLFPELSGAQIADTLEPELARRTVASKDGGFFMLHQGARNGDIELKGMHDQSGASPYGGMGTCRGVVGTEITKFDIDGKPIITGQLSDVLAVDVAESPVSSEIAVAVAGGRDPLQPSPVFTGTLPVDAALPPGATVSQPVNGGSGTAEPIAIVRYDPSSFQAFQDKNAMGGGCIGPIAINTLSSPATAVGYLKDGRLVAQTREPAILWILESLQDQTGAAAVQIALGGASLLDTGHELFHRDAGAGVACASCHLEGGDDGHVWHFVDQGARRTQSIQVGLEGTAPFHWIGDMSDIATLMENVFVGRMGGVHQTPARSSALEQWMYSVKAPVQLRLSSDAAAMRGQAIFAGEAECSKCHAGAKLTNNMTVDVGTGLALQVPSLIGVAYRGPWLHNGCAATLHDRFNPACGGGNAHGHTEQLTTAQIDDLVAYLETL